MHRRPSVHIIFLPAVLALVVLFATVTAQATPKSSNLQVESRTSAGALPGYSLWAEIPVESPLTDPTYDPVRNRLYIPQSTFPVKIATIDILRSELVSTVELKLPGMRDLVVSADGERLFFSTSAPEQYNNKAIVIIDANTFEETGGFPVPCTNGSPICPIGELAIGPDDRLYANSSLGIQVINSDTGAIVGDFRLPDGYGTDGFAVRGTKLFMVIGTFVWGDQRLLRYDVSAAEPVLELNVPIGYYGRLHSVSSDGAYLLLGEEGLETFQYDAETLQFVRQYQPAPYRFYLARTFTYEGNAIAATYSGLDGEDVQEVVQFNASTGLLERQSDISALPQILMGLPNNQLAAISGAGVQIWRAMDYSTSFPLILSDYCSGGALSDSFDNPESGWPSGANSLTSFGYDQGNYRMDFYEPGSWMAVSRGDYWNGAQSLAVEGWLGIGAGYFGLVFGLNDDWTDFYTFEHHPELGPGAFVILHYTVENGWELVYPINPQRSGNVVRSTSDTRLVIEASGDDMKFYIDSFNHYMPAVSGRVGLIAGSLPTPDTNDWIPVEARFDNYQFVGKNCPLLPNRVTPAEFANLTGVRPSLEEMLKRP